MEIRVLRWRIHRRARERSNRNSSSWAIHRLWVTQHHKWTDTWHRTPWVIGTVLTLVLVVPWYVLAEIRTPGFLRYFFVGEHLQRFLIPHWSGDLYGAGRSWPRGTIWLFGLVAALPWSATLVILLFRHDHEARSSTGPIFGSLAKLSALLAPGTACCIHAFRKCSHHLCRSGSVCLCAAVRVCGATNGDWIGVYGFPATAAIVPLLFLGAVIAITIDPGTRFLPTQANVDAALRKLSREDQLSSDYVFNFPNSAKFYTGGHAKFLRDEHELAAAWRKAKSISSCR